MIEDKAWKIELVRQIAQSISDRMIEDIRDERIPPEWGGKQLKQLFADRAARMVSHMDRKERAEYNNTVIVENL